MRIKYKFFDHEIDQIFQHCYRDAEEISSRILKWRSAGFFKKIWLFLQIEKPGLMDEEMLKYYLKTMNELKNHNPHKKIADYSNG